MIFDQYSRYQACADLLRQVGLTPKKTLIDVGSGPECLFGQFIPDVQITYVDPLIQLNSAKNFITGDVFSDALDNKNFDCVTAVDVFEHVPPDQRYAFLNRLSSLGRDILVLGFPTSDSSEASKVDSAISAEYKAVFGVEYSWLEEHDRYGLPSLQDTVHQLEKTGWHCKTFGHGYAPWLTQLLGLVVKVLHIPEMKNAVERISERFNRELYKYDFRTPYYRQFVVATRTPSHQSIIAPFGPDVKTAENIFKSLMLEAERDFLEVSINKIVNQDAINSQEQQKIAQVSEWGRSMSQQVEAHAQRIEVLMQTIGERDAQITDYNAKIVQVSEWGRSMSQQVEAHAQRIEVLMQTIGERDAQITDYNAKIAQVSEWGRSMSQQVEAHAQRIEVLMQTIGERDAQITDYNAKIVQVSEWGRSMSQQVEAHAQRIEVLMQTIGERDAQITDYNTKIEQVRVEKEALSLDLLNKDERMHIVESELTSLKGVVHRLELQLQLSEQKKMELSDWAYEISQHPFSYGIKQLVFRVIRKIWLHAPLGVAKKNRLRALIKKLLGRKTKESRTANSAKVENPVSEGAPTNHGKRDVFVFAVIDWHFRMQRPQHIARSLAQAGRRVFYFSNHFLDVDEPGYGIEPLHGADNIFQIKLHVKGAPAIYFEPPSQATLSMLTKSMALVIKDFGAISTLSVIQHAFWYPLVKKLPNSYRIYDCMDHHEGFGNVPTKLIEIEEEMLHHADLVTVTSEWLKDFAYKYNQNVAIVRNAAEYDHFATRPEQIYCDKSGRRIIGYYGAIAEWFDVDLVRSIAKEYPDCAILLVGDDTVNAKASFVDLSNVYFTGEVPYADLPFYLYAFDVCILPFKVIPLTLATNPVKVYEYLAAGKPVISVDLPEISQFGNLVLRAQSKSDFLSGIGNLLNQSSEIGEHQSLERRSFASEQTWSHRGEEFLKAVEAIKMPRISVIILTFNNLDFTKACLESVLHRSDYPNLEVIVVDNSSSDGTIAYLEDLAREYPDLRIVLNSENLGFAAGNNVGLNIATGDYLILLNNDTVVTQGWVLSMLRHFQANSNLGLLGPVTNNIGNEARIEIHYSNVKDMPNEVLRYTLSHMGESYPMRNVAFFCVMMTRSTYERCGPISEDYGRGFFEDDDYCRKVDKEGLTIACADDVFVHHYLSASFSKLEDIEMQDLFKRNKMIYEAKWGSWIPHAYRNSL